MKKTENAITAIIVANTKFNEINAKLTTHAAALAKKAASIEEQIATLTKELDSAKTEIVSFNNVCKDIEGVFAEREEANQNATSLKGEYDAIKKEMAEDIEYEFFDALVKATDKAKSLSEELNNETGKVNDYNQQLADIFNNFGISLESTPAEVVAPTKEELKETVTEPIDEPEEEFDALEAFLAEYNDDNSNNPSAKSFKLKATYNGNRVEGDYPFVIAFDDRIRGEINALEDGTEVYLTFKHNLSGNGKLYAIGYRETLNLTDGLAALKAKFSVKNG